MASKGDPDRDGPSGRVSRTATDTQSVSTNMWRLIEHVPEIRQSLDSGLEQLVRGDTVSMSALRAERGEGSR